MGLYIFEMTNYLNEHAVSPVLNMAQEHVMETLRSMKEEAAKLEIWIDNLSVSINRLEESPYKLAKIREVESYITGAIRIEEQLLKLSESYESELINLAFGD